MPVGPKGLVIVRRLLETEQEAAVLMGDVTEDSEQEPDEAELRVIVLGKSTVITELLGMLSDGVILS